MKFLKKKLGAVLAHVDRNRGANYRYIYGVTPGHIASLGIHKKNPHRDSILPDIIGRVVSSWSSKSAAREATFN